MKHKILRDWTSFEIIWLSIFSSIALLLTIIWKDTLFGLVVFITGVLCVVLTAKGSIWSFFFGLFNTLGYAYIAYSNNLFGEMGLNIFFFLPMNFVGFMVWKNHMTRENVVEMREMDFWGLVRIFVICLVGIAAMGYSLSLIAAQNTPYIDATTNVLSMVATILTVKRYKEQWVLYILLNVFTIIMWSLRIMNGSPDGALMVVMWSAYLINAFYGYFNWSRGSRAFMEEVTV
jgi:nicotinamide mononucleotide transporter